MDAQYGRKWMAFRLADAFAVEGLPTKPAYGQIVGEVAASVMPLASFSGRLGFAVDDDLAIVADTSLFVAQAFDGKDHVDTEVRLAKCIELLLLHALCPVDSGDATTYREMVDDDLAWTSNDARAGSWISTTLDPSALEEIKRRWPSWGVRPECLNAAVEALEDAVFTQVEAHTAVYSIISLEALATILPGKKVQGKQEKGRCTLVRRIPNLIGRNEEEKSQLAESLNLVYPLRNKRTHGEKDAFQLNKLLAQMAVELSQSNQLPVAADDLAFNLLRMASTAILGFYDRLSNGETIEHIISDLD